MATKTLRCVTWNCNGALRNKWRHLAELKADIYIVQECEDPSRTNDAEYTSWSANHLWIGNLKSKGIGIFASPGFSLEPVSLEPVSTAELFLPCLVNGTWPLVGVWTQHAPVKSARYVGQLANFVNAHKSFLTDASAILMGDTNSNTIWDKDYPRGNHSDVVLELSAIGMRSAYHQHFSEEQGEETRPTFLFHRNAKKPFHIDFGFVGSSWAVHRVEIGPVEDWLSRSDHLPMVFDLTNIG